MELSSGGKTVAQSMGFIQKYMPLQLAWSQGGSLLSSPNGRGENAEREMFLGDKYFNML